MKTKKKILACAVILLCLSVMAQSTHAFYVRSDTARNVITTSRIDIDLRETDADGDPFVDQYHVLPGQQLEKEVTVRNTGPQDAYIRVRLDKLFQGAGSQTDPALVRLDINEDDRTCQDGYYYRCPIHHHGG